MLFKKYMITLALLSSVHFVQAAGLLIPIGSQAKTLKIRSQEVKVQIDSGFVHTQVEQVFHNSSNRDLEAIYQFPVPKKASISEFTAWIQGKPVTAEVLEKGKARKIYQTEKDQGRTTGLAEKEGYKRFEIRVSPVLAGQDIKIRFAYFQTAKIDSNVGRYLYPLEEGGTDEKIASFWNRESEIQEFFHFTLNLRSSYPVDALRMPGFSDAKIQKISAKEWQVEITRQNGQSKMPKLGNDDFNSIATPEINKKQQQDKMNLDQDMLVYWRLEPNLPGSIDLISYKKANDNMGTFMMTITPAMDLKPIPKGRDWIFVLDISGSMQNKYQTLSKGVQRAFTQMKPEDRFRIITFNNHAQEITSGWQSVTPQNIQHATTQLKQLNPHNGTNLYAGLSKALKVIDRQQTSGIILVTDGVANVGITEQSDFLALLKKMDIRLFTFIMGNSANEPLLDGLTKASHGFAINISNADDIIGKLLEATSKLSHQALRDVQFKITGVKTQDISPQYIKTLYRGEQLIILGRYFDGGNANIQLTGKIGQQQQQYSTHFQFPKQDLSYPELERLWAYASILEKQQRIDFFGEQQDDKQAIIQLGLKYGLVTNYTSMILLEEDAYAEYGITRHNQQRLQRERQAQQQRISQPIAPHRVDQSKPAFSSRHTPSFGGGAIDMGWILVLMPLLLSLLRTFVRKSQLQ